MALGETTVNEALLDAEVEYSPQLDFEPDGIWINLVIANEFLNQETPVRAKVELTLSDDTLQFSLDNFEAAEGPTVTRTQVRNAISAIGDSINTALQTLIPGDADSTQWTAFTLQPDFLLLDIR
jgi:hypothetical protein